MTPCRLVSDGRLANACPHSEAHRACLACLFEGPTVSDCRGLERAAGHICQSQMLAGHHVACCLESGFGVHGVLFELRSVCPFCPGRAVSVDTKLDISLGEIIPPELV